MARFLAWILLLAMAPWPVAVPYAHQAYLVREVGQVPHAFEFASFDADTGAFLYGIAKRDCPVQVARSPEPEASWSQRSRQWAWRGNWDAGADAGSGMVGQLRTQGDEIYAQECRPLQAGSRGAAEGTWNPDLVFAEAGHFPQLRGPAVWLSLMGNTAHVPSHSLGPSGWQEHRVVTVGDPLEVRVWSGVGEKNWRCGSILPPGRHISNWFYDNNPSSETRVMLMCVSYRYVGGDLSSQGILPAVAL